MASDLQNKNLSESITLKDNRPPSAEKKQNMEEDPNNSTIHWFAQMGESGSNEVADRNREEKLRIAKERQNEDRQRKIEELKAQAEAAQRFREQKEEERRRRIEELRSRDTEKRHQVEERKRAIMEAEKERREYIMRKNQERVQRLETKKRHEKSQIVFAFGSSTPRLLDPADMVSSLPGSYWGNRRSTSISNVAYAGPTLSRRSSERELSDGSKKRATSAGGIDRNNDALHRNKSGSMYEVFNWGFCNDEPPKRYSLSIIGNEIDIDGPCNNKINNNTNTNIQQYTKQQQKVEDSPDSSALMYRSVARRKTDLMPTIPMPREPNFGSKSSLSHTPRTPGRAVSMTRLDQLAQPVRRNGEHIRAIIERERIQQLESEMMNNSNNNSPSKSMSRSMTHLSGNNHNNNNIKQNNHNNSNNNNKNRRGLNSSLSKNDSSKSMTQLATRAISSTKKFLNRFTKTSDLKKDDAQTNNNLNNNSNNLSQSGSRSGDVTPGGSINPSRPGSAMSTSTTASSLVQRRTVPTPKKPRPASIAGTGVTLHNDEHRQKKDKPPIPKTHQITPKRTSLSNSSSITKLSSSAEKKTTPIKKESVPTSKPATPNVKHGTPSKVASTNHQTPSKTPPIRKPPTSGNNKLQENYNKLHESINEKQYEVIVKEATSVQPNNITDEQKVQANQQPQPELQHKIEQQAPTQQQQQPEFVPEIQSKAEKDAINIEKIDTIDIIEIVPNSDGHSESVIEITNTEVGFETIVNGTSTDITATITNATITNNDVSSSSVNDEIESFEEKVDQDTEKGQKGRGASIERQQQLQIQENEMTASMIARKITTEEQAKAALAERRRLAREEAERQAELERQRLEAERLEELRRQAEEEERQRQFEEEATRLAIEQRKAEEERLQQAIEEARKREEEERIQREEDEKLKVEREETERKAKEEAEKQRLEVAERLKREEKEREERRKRVEAIMSRTRKAGGNGGTPNSTPTKESNGESKTIESNGELKTDEQKMTEEEKVANNNINESEEQPQLEIQQQEQYQQEQHQDEQHQHEQHQQEQHQQQQQEPHQQEELQHPEIQQLQIEPEQQQSESQEIPKEYQIQPEQQQALNNEIENDTTSMSENNSNVTNSSNNISDVTNNGDNNLITKTITTTETVVKTMVPEEIENKIIDNSNITSATTTITTVVTTETTNDNNIIPPQQQQQPTHILSYEQSVTDKENALMKNFSNMIIDQQQNVKNLQQNLIENFQSNNPFVEVTNGTATTTNNELISQTIANGNGHIENMNFKNDAKSLVEIASDQLIDFGSESQQISNDAVNFNNNNNNNNILTSSTTLVTADSHENKEISLL